MLIVIAVTLSNTANTSLQSRHAQSHEKMFIESFEIVATECSCTDSDI